MDRGVVQFETADIDLYMYFTAEGTPFFHMYELEKKL